ncbi:MAG: succinate--CoA ligase subunit beta [Alphaproteobacteria bacterium]|nr:succinate--CoA ligase subunit beta [Alphaproteobacteria bacterium]
MNIHEYQAKKIFKTFGINVPKGIIAYTPLEAKNAALEISNNGPWVVKAQIQSGSRDLGKFHDKRAGKKGGIRLSKTIDEVFENADEMLENLLVTNQTGKKGRLVSRIYIEEYIKTIEKFYIGLVVDWVSASTVLLIAPVSNKNDDNIVEMASSYPENILKINLGLQKELTSEQLKEITDFMESDVDKRKLKSFINKMLKLFYSYDATMLEINPIGIDKNGEIWALDAKIIFDNNALYRHKEIIKLTDEAEIEERELIASKYGFQYRELESGIGIISNGDGFALNIINEAQKLGLNTACFLNLKGGVDRDKIAASIKLIMTNPKVDGIFINILGGFLRCNLIADGIITVADDLGLNIPLVARFEGTNKEDATNILQKSGLSFLLAKSTKEGLEMLKEAIEEDL